MAGRALPPTSSFAADDGAADPALASALDACATGSGSVADVVAVLARARVLVPVVAVGEAGSASAGVVAVVAPDGRTALPVFSSVAALMAWRADARPVPVEGPRAAAAAATEGWDLLVVDPGAACVVVPRPAVRALATGTSWQPAVQGGRVRPAVRDAVLRALDGVAGLLTVDVLPGRRAEVAVVLGVRPGLAREQLDALVAAVSERLAAHASDDVDSLELRVSGGDAG